MYWAVLNHARTSVLRLTIRCAIKPVRPAITMGHGGGNKRTEARNGMNTTDEPIRAFEIRGTGRNAESLAIPNNANATRAFQNDVLEMGGRYHSVANSSEIAATLTAASKSRKLHRSNWG